jgi:PAS domain S-box-containing protein
VDERGNIVSLNTAAEALLALHDSDACGESFIHTAIAVSERERLSSELEGILQLNHKPEESRRLCTRIVRGGAEFAAEVTLVPDPMPGITQLLVWIRELS